MAEKKLIKLTVNGAEREVLVKPNWSLYYLLKRQLGLTGVKQSCDGIGECGYCTVIMDGKAVYSCLVLAIECEGKNITTIEGLLSGGNLHPIQKAFLEYGAFQCGHCTPAMVLAAKALLDNNPIPNEEETKEAISGIICRCTGYYKFVEAIISLSKEGQHNEK
ncbi:MAG: (2Fe-2S)-binding protein [Candidatus Hodarchaeota archaeon]